MPTANFDDHTAIELLSSDDESNMWGGRLSADWSIGRIPNGGYSSALSLRALLEHSGCETPLSITTHFHRPTIAETDLLIETRLLRQGRATTHAEATLSQEGKVRLHSVAILGPTPGSEVLLHSPPPAIPSPAESIARDPKSQGLNMSILDTLDVRLHPDTPQPPVNGRAGFEGWMRFRDGRANDALALNLFADAFPPAAIASVPNVGWVPTLELTTHIRAAAAPGWIRCKVSTSDITDDYGIEDLRLWDSTDRLVVETRQLAALRYRDPS